MCLIYLSFYSFDHFDIIELNSHKILLKLSSLVWKVLNFKANEKYFSAESYSTFCLRFSAWARLGMMNPLKVIFFFLQIILSNSVRTFLLSPNPHTDSIIIMVVFTALQKFIDRILDTIRKYFPKTSNKTQWHKIITKLYGLHCTICCKHRG